MSWLFTSLLSRGGALQVQGMWTYDAASKQVQVSQLPQQRQTFSFPSDVEPANVELDPESWVMMQASFVKK